MKQGHCFVFLSTTLSHANETRGDQNKHGFEAEFHAKCYHHSNDKVCHSTIIIRCL